MNVAKMIVYQARLHEQAPALAFAGGVATYGLLMRAVLAVSRRIEERGLAAGSIVAVDIHNPFHHIATIIALELHGIATAALQTAFNVQQTGLEPAAILSDSAATFDAGIPVVAVGPEWFAVDPLVPVDFDRLAALPGFGDRDALVRVVFSSGTTGIPKATALTSAILERRIAHNVLIALGNGLGGFRLATMMGFSTLPGYMMPATVLSSGGMLCVGGSGGEMLHLMRSFRVDVLFAAVAQLNAILAALGASVAPPLRLVIALGSKLPLPLRAAALARLCANMMFVYGSTETGMIAQAPAALLGEVDGAAGYRVPWADLQVVDENDKPLPPGSEGVFRVRTDEQAHYVSGDRNDSAFFRDGWFYPGDIGRLGADGFVHVTGRSVEVINRGGSIVAPELVERVLALRPEVRDAAAFGVAGAGGMEEIWAAIVTDDAFDEQALIRFCREKLADKAPGTIRRVGAIPRTETGKIRRSALRDAVVARA